MVLIRRWAVGGAIVMTLFAALFWTNRGVLPTQWTSWSATMFAFSAIAMVGCAMHPESNRWLEAAALLAATACLFRGLQLELVVAVHATGLGFLVYFSLAVLTLFTAGLLRRYR